MDVVGRQHGGSGLGEVLQRALCLSRTAHVKCTARVDYQGEGEGDVVVIGRVRGFA